MTQNDPDCEHFLQEFAGLVRRALEEQPEGEAFRSRLEDVYTAAMEEGLWRGGPASVGVEGYWAETVKYWLWGVLPDSVAADGSGLAEYDADVASLIGEVLGEASVPSYCKP